MSWTRQCVHIKEELEYIRHYISLINLRYDSHIDLSINISDSLLEFEIIKLLIQPLVENSVIHGIIPRGDNGSITISIYKEGKVLYIEVADDGIGIPVDRLEELNSSILMSGDMPDTNRSSIGLANVNERIKVFYGNEYGVTIESVYGHCTKAVLRLPNH